MTSDLAKRGKLDTLKIETRDKLASIKDEQTRFVDGLRLTLEKEFRGNQPTDANSVLLRRDASERTRKLDRQDALGVLQDAIANGDPEMGHAVGQRARNYGWEDVAEAYTAAYPETADSAEALAWVESNTSGAAYNLSNGITFAAPAD